MNRIPDYDYSQPGLYLNTICTLEHRLCFGKISDAQMHLNPCGEVIQSLWNALPSHYPHIKCDAFICMPNHVHMIIELIELDDHVNGKREPSWEIVRAFKARASFFIRRLPDKPWFAWQSRTFESLLTTERRLNYAREYIRTNPIRWEQDKFYKHY